MAIRFLPLHINDVVAFWNNSPYATVFTHPEVLQCLSDKVEWWMAWEGEEPVCFWPICMPDGKNVGIPGFTYYVGPMWSQSIHCIPNHRWLAMSSRVYEGFIELFLTRYGAINACFPLGLLDVRVFDWWNYHEANKPRFQIRPRYTACINNLQDKQEDEIIADFRELRRRELRRIRKIGPPMQTTNWTVKDILNLYNEVMARQNIVVSEKIHKQIISLVDLVNRGFGEVVAFYDDKCKQVVAALLLLYGKGVANMVLNLVSDSWRTKGLSAWAILNSIMIAQKRGISCFDFNGANSPNRGDDKHSYGATPVLYFEIKYPGN